MVKFKYQRKPVRGKRKVALRSIPDMSMTVPQLYERFVKNLPIDAVQREAVYADQSEHDLEKLSRMDFGEKHEFAQQTKAEVEQKLDAINEARRDKARRAKERAEAKSKTDAKAQGATGVGSLDNTTPDDTSL